MKIHVTIDLAEMFTADHIDTRGCGYDMEVDGVSFQDAIKDAIKNDIVQQVLAEWRKECSAGFTKEILAVVSSMKDEYIAGVMESISREKLIDGDRWACSGEKISVYDAIKAQLLSYFVKNGTDEKIAKIARESATTQAKEAKDRYDLLFASQLVAKMNDSGLLRDDVARLLFQPPAGSP